MLAVTLSGSIPPRPLHEYGGESPRLQGSNRRVAASLCFFIEVEDL